MQQRETGTIFHAMWLARIHSDLGNLLSNSRLDTKHSSRYHLLIIAWIWLYFGIDTQLCSFGTIILCIFRVIFIKRSQRTFLTTVKLELFSKTLFSFWLLFSLSSVLFKQLNYICDFVFLYKLYGSYLPGFQFLFSRTQFFFSCTPHKHKCTLTI